MRSLGGGAKLALTTRHLFLFASNLQASIPVLVQYLLFVPKLDLIGVVAILLFNGVHARVRSRTIL